MKNQLFLLVLIASATMATENIWSQSLSLDPSFGDGGILEHPFGEVLVVPD